MPIATSLQNEGSLTWKVPDDAGTLELRVVVKDSSVPSRTASTTVTIEIVQNSPDSSLIIGAAALLPITAIAAIVLTVKRKHNGKKNRESKTNSLTKQVQGSNRRTVTK